MAGNDEFIYTLKNANPIEDVIRSYVSLKRQGKNYVCNCPFHSEKTPSCTIFLDTQTFHCFGCHAGGDVISFIRMIENVEFPEAVKILAQRSGVELPEYNGKGKQITEKKTKIYEMNRLAANFFYLNLKNGKNPIGRNYFNNRKLSPQTIHKYGLGYASDSWSELTDYLHSKGYTYEEIIDAWLGKRSSKGNVIDIFRNRVMFPIVDKSGNVIGFGGRVLDDSQPKYMNTGKTLVFDKGSNLFSLNFAKDSSSKKMILCEGYMDVIAVNQAGFDNVVASLGTAITPEQARLISRYADEVIISYDSDSAGQNATQKAVNYFSEVGIKTRVLHMEGAKDPDEYIKKFGADRFRRLIDNSGDAINFMIESCENGLDVSSEMGKAEFLKRVSEVLAGIESDITREVYVSSVAEKYKVNNDVLRSHVEDICRKKLNIKNKVQWNDTVNKQVINIKDNINPEAVKLKKQANAEECIIFRLMERPEDVEKIVSEVPTDIFVTSFNKKVYSALINKMRESENFSISLLSDEFSLEELSRVSEIQAVYRDKNINQQVFEDCAKVLKDYKNKKHIQEGDISDEDLRSLFSSKNRH